MAILLFMAFMDTRFVVFLALKKTDEIGPREDQRAALQRALDCAPRPLRGLVNEILGVHHVKVFAVDDAVVLSSANLSDEYFSTRRDRCVVVRDARVAAWHHDLVAILADADAVSSES